MRRYEGAETRALWECLRAPRRTGHGGGAVPRHGRRRACRGWVVQSSFPRFDFLGCAATLLFITCPPDQSHLNIHRSQTHAPAHTLCTVMVMNKASSWLSAAALGAAALLVAVEEGQAFVLPQSRVLSGARQTMGTRVRGLVQAVQSMPPPTTTSTSSPAEKGPWSPESWRQYTPRQMPVYEDQVSREEQLGGQQQRSGRGQQRDGMTEGRGHPLRHTSLHTIKPNRRSCKKWRRHWPGRRPWSLRASAGNFTSTLVRVKAGGLGGRGSQEI